MCEGFPHTADHEPAVTLLGSRYGRFLGNYIQELQAPGPEFTPSRRMDICVCSRLVSGWLVRVGIACFPFRVCYLFMCGKNPDDIGNNGANLD